MKEQLGASPQLRLEEKSMARINTILLCFLLNYTLFSLDSPSPLPRAQLLARPQRFSGRPGPLCPEHQWKEEEAVGYPSLLSWEVPERERFRFVGPFARWYLIRILMLMAFG